MPDVIVRLNHAFAGRYHLERELGRGGMATVYLAQDLKHQRQVAIKVLLADVAAAVGAERFQREIEFAARLQHPHILALYDSGEADGFLCYVMPYVEGPTLRARLVGEGQLSIAEVVRILRDVVDGVAAAHAQGVVHRDLKPENIMLPGRHALVVDFGVAKALSEASGDDRFTSAGVTLGTAAYMAPEQAAGDAQADHRSDIYALGVIAYELLTGSPPFVRDTKRAVLAAHLTEVPVPVMERREGVPPLLALLVMRCLAKDPADRPQRAEDLLVVLEGLAMSNGNVTPLDVKPVPSARVRRRKPRLRPLIAAAIGVVVLGVAVWAAFSLRTPALPQPLVREPVVVLPFLVRGSDSALQGLGVDVADQLAAALDGNNVAKAVTYRPASPAREFTRRLGARALKETGAGTLIAGVVAKRGGAIEVEARLIRGSDLGIVWTLGPERGSAADPTATLDRLRERVLGAVYWYLSPQWGQRHEASVWHPPPSLEVARLVEEADARMQAFSPSQAFPRYREAAARDTTWLHPVVAMLEANRGRACYPWCSKVPGRVVEVDDSLDAFLNARRDRLSQGDARSLDLLRARRAPPGDEVQAILALLAIDSFYVGMAMGTHFRANRLNEALRYHARRDTTDTRGVWRDDIAADIYDQLGRFEDVLALARSTKLRDGAFLQEVSALAAQGDIDEIERVIARSHTLRGQADPIWLIGRAALELSLHGWEKESRVYAERVLAEMRQWPDSLDRAGMMYRRDALAILGRYEDAARSLEELGRRNPAEARASRIQAMPFRIAAGDTVGALALVDSIRTQPLTAFYPWSYRGEPLYFGAQILSCLDRKEQAVIMLREALSNGARVAVPPDYSPHMRLRWVWAPLRGYSPFEELVRPR